MVMPLTPDKDEAELRPRLLAWLETGDESFREPLRRLMTRRALEDGPARRAWAFIHELGARAAGPETAVRRRELLDQAAENFLEARLRLAALEIDDQKRRLALFLKRAGFSAEAVSGPVCGAGHE